MGDDLAYTALMGTPTGSPKVFDVGIRTCRTTQESLDHPAGKAPRERRLTP